jgi:hypothetical protein
MTAKILGLFSSMALAALMGSASQAHANPPDPPQEAIDACANLKDGAACTLSFHGHTDARNMRKGSWRKRDAGLHAPAAAGGYRSMRQFDCGRDVYRVPPRPGYGRQVQDAAEWFGPVGLHAAPPAA